MESPSHSAPHPLSPSHNLFFQRTGIHPDSEAIEDPVEHRLFMKMRINEQWRSDLLAKGTKMHDACALFNQALKRSNPLAHLKRDRAFKLKLEKVEGDLLKRKVQENWSSKCY